MSLTPAAREPERAPAVDAGVLWLEFREHLRAFVARRIDAADVDDTVQWVFLRLHENRAGLERADRVHAWLYRTARRAIADYYRTRARRRETAAGSAADLEALPVAPLAEDDADDLRQAEACVAPLVASLPLPYREALVMADLEEVRLADAARAAGVSLSGMKSRVQRGRQRLKKLLLECCHDALEGSGLACSAGPCACCGPRA